MSKKFLLWLISVAIVVSLAIIIVLSNEDQLTISLFPGWSFSGNKGVIMLLLFLSGIAITCLIGSYFGIKAYITEWQLKKRELFYKEIFFNLHKNRGLLLTGSWKTAQIYWQQILKEDKKNTTALLELAHCFEEKGDLHEAIKTIEIARVQDTSNLEVLTYAASLHERSGNKTVALDNLALALHNQKTAKLLAWASKLAEEIGRINDAIYYQQELTKLNDNKNGLQNNNETLERLYFKEMQSKLSDKTPQEKKEILKEFIRKYTYPKAYLLLSDIYISENNFQEAAQYLTTIAKKTKKISYWYKLVTLWSNNQEPAKALAAARAAITNTNQKDNITAQILLILELLKQGQFEEVKLELNKLKDINTSDQEIQYQLFSTLALTAFKLGDNIELNKSLSNLIKILFESVKI